MKTEKKSHFSNIYEVKCSTDACVSVQMTALVQDKRFLSLS